MPFADPRQQIAQGADRNRPGRGAGQRTRPPGGLPDPVLDDRLLGGDPLSSCLGRACGPGILRIVVPGLGVDRAQGRQVRPDLVELWRLDGQQGSGPAALHPVQHARGRTGPDDHIQAHQT